MRPSPPSARMPRLLRLALAGALLAGIAIPNLPQRAHAAEPAHAQPATLIAAHGNEAQPHPDAALRATVERHGWELSLMAAAGCAAGAFEVASRGARTGGAHPAAPGSEPR